MGGPCESCCHFRARRSFQVALRVPVSRGLEHVRQEMMRADQEFMAQETSLKRSQMSAQQDCWPFRPTLESYCAEQEARGYHYIHEVRNAGQHCPAHRPVAGPPRNCRSCRHNVVARGHDTDHQNMLDVMSGLNTGGVDLVDGRPRKQPHQYHGEMDTVRQDGQMRQSMEVSQAIHGGGTVFDVPSYFDWCRRYSEGGSYELSALRNADGRCGGWEGGGPAQGWGGQAATGGSGWDTASYRDRVPERVPSRTFRDLAERLIRERNRK